MTPMLRYLLLILGSGQPVNAVTRLAGGAAAVLGLAALGLFAYVQSARAQRSNRVDEHAVQRLNLLLVCAIALAIAGFAILLALGSLVWALIVVGVAAAWAVVWSPHRMRRDSTTTSVVIGRDPAVVFDFLSDFRSQLEYAPDVVGVEKLTDGPIGVGTQFRTKVRLRSGTFEATDQITDFEPDVRYASSVVPAVHPNSGTAFFEPVPGGTRVTFRFDYELSYVEALLAAAFMRWRVRQRIIARRQVVWARVKQILESRPQPTT